mgnify:CR=1 FL=1
MSRDGSSPLSRGIRHWWKPLLRRLRIIPALAGNTQGTGFVFRFPGDHPRSRGEYGFVEPLTAVDAGSSPLSRGIQASIVAGNHHGGIIPALAGNTVVSAVVICWARDHPRSRGEYVIVPVVAAGEAGSSPLSRGIRPRSPQPGQRIRIIPALAGNTAVKQASKRTRAGSSPLSRGIQPCPIRCVLNFGIIPALAGNTRCVRTHLPPPADHPRSRGEYPYAEGLILRV